jgi:hypothetical protein
VGGFVGGFVGGDYPPIHEGAVAEYVTFAVTETVMASSRASLREKLVIEKSA